MKLHSEHFHRCPFIVTIESRARGTASLITNLSIVVRKADQMVKTKEKHKEGCDGRHNVTADVMSEEEPDGDKFMQHHASWKSSLQS